MACRRKHRRPSGLSAVARHGSEYRGKRSRSRFFSVDVQINRDTGASTARQYHAHACVVTRSPVRRRGRDDKRCGFGSGRTPTAAGKKALRALSVRLK